MSRDCYCSVSLPHDVKVGQQCVIMVFPDHIHFHFAVMFFLLDCMMVGKASNSMMTLT